MAHTIKRTRKVSKKHTNNSFFLALGITLTLLTGIFTTAYFTKMDLNTRTHAQSLNTSFVTRSGNQLMLDGKVFRFAGTNIYWLGLDENNGGSVGGVHYPTKYAIDDALDTAKETGATVVRSHTLGISVGCPLCLEPSLNSFNDQAFNTIDYAIYAAGQRGIRLIIPFTDGNTPCFYEGCRRTFVNWSYPGSTNDDLFFTDAAVINNFKTYITHIVNHVNPYTGVALKDDPTILGWQSGNELDEGTTVTTNWLTTVGQHVKSLDQKHLFIDGGWAMDSGRLAITTVDMYTRHHYQNWYYPGGTGTAIDDDNHYACLAINANKVYFVGEYDWTEQKTTPLTLSTYLPNIENYHCTGTTVNAIAGDLYWSLFPHHDTYGFETHGDGYTLNYIGNTSWMRNNAQALRTHAFKMSGQSTPVAAGLISRAPLLRTPNINKLTWQGVAGAAYYQIERSNDNGVTWTSISPNTSPTDGVAGGLTDNDAPWTDANGISSSKYRIRAYNFDGVSGPYSSGYDNSTSGAPAPVVLPTDTPAVLPTNTPVPTSTPQPTVTPVPAATNLIQNSSFENTGTSWLLPWKFQVNTGAKGTISQDSSTKVSGSFSAKVAITKSNNSPSYVQLFQGNLSVISGRTYTVSFSAKASKNSNVAIYLQQNYSPYTHYFEQTSNLTTSWATYTYSFIAPATDNNIAIIFGLANATGTVWIDNVSIK
jgi:mannan endo-1,4-beta-mannosidase